MRYLFLPALLAVVLVTGCGRTSSARVDAALAPLIPADTVALACLRLDKLHDTPFYARYVEGKKIPVLERFADETGLDVRKDIWEMVLLIRPRGKQPLVLIRGKFGGQFGVEPTFTKPGLQKMNYKGYYIIYVDGPGVLFMNTGAAVAGPIEDLKFIIDNRDNPKWGPPKGLLELAGSLPGGSQIWMVCENGGALLPELPQEGQFANFGRMARSLGVFTFHADLRDGIQAIAEGHYSDQNAAKQMNDTLRGLVGIARLRTPDNQPDMLRLYDGIRIGADGPVLTVNITAPFSLVEKIISLLPESRRPGS